MDNASTITFVLRRGSGSACHVSPVMQLTLSNRTKRLSAVKQRGLSQTVTVPGKLACLFMSLARAIVTGAGKRDAFAAFNSAYSNDVGHA
jgi:hypothetical protein